uniref:Secreted protein n=1 Tax=Crocodylus porosus TaxID=8502 RepID=A0A7M4E4R4_CROPO
MRTVLYLCLFCSLEDAIGSVPRPQLRQMRLSALCSSRLAQGQRSHPPSTDASSSRDLSWGRCRQGTSATPARSGHSTPLPGRGAAWTRRRGGGLGSKS